MPESTPVSSQMRLMVKADLVRVLAWRNHIDVRRFMYNQHEISLDEHQRWFENASLDHKKQLLIYEYNHQPLGFVNFSEAGKGGIVDWGFYVAPEAPNGIGRLLGRTALNHAFIQLKLHKICGQALAYNERSIHFHQSLGFQQEGILRDQHFDGDTYHNTICFGLLFHEWQSKP